MRERRTTCPPRQPITLNVEVILLWYSKQHYFGFQSYFGFRSIGYQRPSKAPDSLDNKTTANTALKAPGSPDNKTTTNTALKAPGSLDGRGGREQALAASRGTAARTSLRSSSLALLARAVLASSGLVERAGPFHSHPAGWTGRAISWGWTGRAVPCGWTGRAVPWGWTGWAVSWGWTGRAVSWGWTGWRPATRASHTLPSRFARYAHSSLARAFLAHTPPRRGKGRTPGRSRAASRAVRPEFPASSERSSRGRHVSTL